MATTTTSLKPGTRRRELLRTWRGQILVLIALMLVLAVAAFLAAISTTNNRIQTFQKLAAVAVPSINATNDAIQYLSGEVSNTADYILAGQGKGSVSIGSEAAGTAGTDQTTVKQGLLRQIEAQRASYDQALQSGFSSLTDDIIKANPSAQTALTYISSRNARLHDALAQARGLADSGKFTEAIQAYLNGQNAYYTPVIASLYFLRSSHIFLLEDSEREATSAANFQQNLAAAATVIFAISLLAISVLFSLRVKRVLLPLVNIALVIVVVYSFLLWAIFNGSGKDLADVVESYNQTAFISDTRLNLTDSFADEVLWVISNDAVYSTDIDKKTVRVLAAADDTEKVTNPAALLDCPSNAASRLNYKGTGAMADVCRNLNKPEEVTAFNQFLVSYRTWLGTNTRFQTFINGQNADQALNLRAGDGAKAFSQMTKNLNDLNKYSVDQYSAKSKSATDALNMANFLAWLIYPAALLLAGGGLLLWRQEF